MNEQHHLSSAGANLIKHFEGCLQPHAGKYKAYKCPAGVATIGWGHTNHHGRKFDMTTVWDIEDCDECFLEDMANFEMAVRRLVTHPINGFQYDALVSFCFNCGEGNLKKSTLLRYVNEGKFDLAAKEFIKWNKAGGKVLSGLTRRRKSESLLFQGIVDDNYDGDPDMPLTYMSDPMAQQVDVPLDDPED
jgi:lysozyme